MIAHHQAPSVVYSARFNRSRRLWHSFFGPQQRIPFRQKWRLRNRDSPRVNNGAKSRPRASFAQRRDDCPSREKDRRMNYWKVFVTPLQNTLERVIAFVPRFLVASVLFILFYGLAALVRRWMRKVFDRAAPHLHWAARVLIIRAIYLFTLLIGLLVALSAVNVNVTTVLASLGVAGFALGFALKDILENFIAGVLLLFSRPFEVGDQVTLGQYEGTITDIQLRTTTVRTYAGEVVTIPSSNVYTNPVVNHTRLGKRGYKVEFDTSLKADASQVE